MIYVWYYCTERANKMRLVSTKDKLVLFCSVQLTKCERLSLSLWRVLFESVIFLSFFSLAKAAHETFTFVILCQNSSYEIPRESAAKRERVRNSERRESAQEKPAVWGGIFQSLTNETQPNHPPKHHLLLWDAHINNDFVLFRPACVCMCVKI